MTGAKSKKGCHGDQQEGTKLSFQGLLAGHVSEGDMKGKKEEKVIKRKVENREKVFQVNGPAHTNMPELRRAFHCHKNGGNICTLKIKKQSPLFCIFLYNS